jgi:hypothetical protein
MASEIHELKQQMVGIFWLVGDRLIVDASSRSEAEPYGDCLTHCNSHIDFWTQQQQLGAVPRDIEYEEGRAQLEENTVQAHMLLTLSREMHVPAFGGVREVDRSPGSLSRHPSFRRAVCVDAHVRICAWSDQRWSSLPRSELQSR